LLARCLLRGYLNKPRNGTRLRFLSNLNGENQKRLPVEEVEILL